MSSLLYSEVEEDLRAAVRQAVSGSASPADLWRALSEIGCPGLAVPEDRGGAGGSWREVAVVAEELGRGVARLAAGGAGAVPFLGTTLATAALLAVAPTDLLAKVASGGTVAVLALPLSSPPGSAVPVTVRAEGSRLHGTVTSVGDAVAAEVLVVPTPDGLFAVDAEAVSLAPLVSLDETRPLCDVTLEATPATLIAGGPAAAAAWGAALTAGAVVLASEQLGVATWCLESTVDYVKTRYQFARPVGSFQAVKHRLAHLWVDVTQARAVARYAAACLADGDPDVTVAASLAQAHCGPTAVKAAEECVQLHGGIGFTWEHPAHWYLKRAKSSAISLGTAVQHRAALGTLVDLPTN
jgi:alkylation response protein AidB-like acyl-CoA dehydrogenase